MKKIILFVITTFFLLSLSDTASASIWCSGTVSKFLVRSSGQLEINGSWRNDWTRICNVNQTWQGVSPTTCLAWFSLVQEARNQNAYVAIQYDEPGLTCATLGTYSNSPVPSYLLRGA